MSVVIDGTNGITTPAMGVGNQSPSNAGIKFPGTAVASSDANTLDDYEEGTWSAVVSDGTNNATMGAGGNIGTYTKIGNMVNIRGYFEISSKGSISGGLRITGLPFKVAALSRNHAGTSFPYAEGLNITAGRSIGAYVEVNQSFCYLTYWDLTTGTSLLQASEINNMAFIIDISYPV
jgi:hypothetical protein